MCVGSSGLPCALLLLTSAASRRFPGAIGRSYADQPLHQSWYFDPLAKSGSRWSMAGKSTIDRLYHSTATLLPDGSILVSGSNPNPDYVDKSIDPTITYVTQYEVEIVGVFALGR